MGSSIYLRMSLCLCIMFCMNTIAYVQRVVINSAGKPVIMYPDGTWRMAESGDSLLIRQYSSQSREGAANAADPNHPQQRNEGEEYDYLLRQWNDLYQDLMAEEKEVQNSFRTATNAQFKAAEELRNAEANIKLVEPDRLASLKEEYDISVDHLRNAKLQQKEIKSLVSKSQKINAQPESISQSKINRIKTSFTIYLSRYQRAQRSVTPEAKHVTPLPASNPEVQATTPIPVVKADPFAPYDPEMLDKRPPGIEPIPYISQPYPCDFDTDTLDKATGILRRELHPEVLFTFTDPDLRPFFKNKDLITCRARLSKIGSYAYLSVEFQIASSHSQSNFGTLAEGSLLRFRLMNGEYVSLYNLKVHNGRIDPYSGYTIFAGQYALEKSELKKLTSSELDKMRVMWSTGYEDYDVHRVDLMLDQIHCLEAKN